MPDEVHGADGFHLRFVRTGAQTGGEVLEMEAAYGGTGRFPPEHLHPSQSEHFAVLEGTIVARIAGTERTYVAGDTFEVPPGTPHTMAATEPSRMRWEVRPALRTQEFFERLFGAGPAPGPTFLDDYADVFRIT